MPPQPPSTNSGTTERIRVRANTAIRTAQNLHFGKLLWVDGSRLLVQLEHPLSPDENVDLRIDLSPLPGTALARGRVVRELARVDGEMPKYLVTLLDVALDDRPRWLSWLEEKRMGGTLSNVSDLTQNEGPLQSGYVKVAQSERAAALDRMKSKSDRFSNPSSSSSWITSDVREAASGRSAMRDALKNAIRKTADAEPPGRVLASVNPPPRTQPSQPPRPISVNPVVRPPPPPEAPKPYAAVTDPVWTSSEMKGNTYVEVKWTAAETFSYDVHSQLLGLTLLLYPGLVPLPRTPPIYMFLRHDPVMIQCEATPIFVTPEHGSYRLTLTPTHLAELRRFARPLSVDQSLAIERKRRR